MSPEQLAQLLTEHHIQTSNGHHSCAAPNCTWTVITYPQLTPPQHTDKNTQALRRAFAKHQADAIIDAAPERDAA